MVLLPLLVINGYFAFIVSLLLYAIIGLSFTSFLHTFYVYPIIKKYMIDNPKADRSGEGSGETSGEAADNAGDDADGTDNGDATDGTDSADNAETQENTEKWVYPGL